VRLLDFPIGRDHLKRRGLGAQVKKQTINASLKAPLYHARATSDNLAAAETVFQCDRV
jgi:hypothetical protein